MSEIRVTTLKDTAGANSSTTADIASGRAKAWVNFNGSSTVAIRANFNVSSITDRGVGNYAVNFTTALTDADYCAVMNARTGGGVQSIITLNRDETQTASIHYVYVVNPATPGTLQDEAHIHVAFFR